LIKNNYNSSYKEDIYKIKKEGKEEEGEERDIKQITSKFLYNLNLF